MAPIGIVLARMGSSRLPAKAMLPLDGKPVLERVINRVTATEGLAGCWLSTTTNAEDDVLASTAEHLGVEVYRGAEGDVLGRVSETAAAADAESIARVGADNPLVPPAVLDALADALDDVAYASTKLTHTFPIGLDADAISVSLLQRAETAASTEAYREHVAQWFKDNRDEFATRDLSPSEFDGDGLGRVADATNVRLTLDEPADYELLARLHREIESDDFLPAPRAVEYAIGADLWEINSDVEQAVY